MPDFAASIQVTSPRRAVIDYVSKVENMPQYLPTLRRAWMSDEDHVGMEVEIDGKRHVDEGFFRATADRLEWGSEEHNYNGQMLVEELDGKSEVTISLYIEPRDGKDTPEWSEQIKTGLREALVAIKTQVESSQRQRLGA